MSIPVKVTVTVTIERSDPSGRVDVYGGIESFTVDRGFENLTGAPPDVHVQVVSKNIFMKAVSQLREAMTKVN